MRGRKRGTPTAPHPTWLYGVKEKKNCFVLLVKDCTGILQEEGDWAQLPGQHGQGQFVAKQQCEGQWMKDNEHQGKE